MCLAAALPLLWAAWACPGAAADDAVELKSGRVLMGQIRDYDGETVEIELSRGGVTRLPLDQLAPRWRYRLRIARRAPSTAADHMALARFAIDSGLVAQAREHLRAALDLDKSLAPSIELRVAELDERAAGQLYSRLVRALKARKYTDARALARAVVERYPRTAPAGWARDLLPAIEEGLANLRPVVDAEEEREAFEREVKRQKRIAERQTRADKLIAAAQRSFRDALGHEGDAKVSDAMKAFEAGATQFEQAVREVERLEKGASSRDEKRELFDQRQRLVHSWVNLSIAAAHLRARQGNYKDAQRWLAVALKLEPLNERAKRFDEFVGKHRIKRSLAEMTNTKPIIQNN